jgi:hypothetical protein
MQAHIDPQVGYPAPPLMPDFAGSPQSVIVSRALFVLLALPLAGALAEMARAAGMFAGAGKDDAGGRYLRTTVVATALAIVAFAAQLLAQSAGDKYLLQHLVTWLRAGQLDANLDLALDPLACGAIAVVVGLVALAAFRLPRAGMGRSAIGLSLVLFGAVLAILSVDLFGVIAGLALVLVALVTTRTGRLQAQVGFGALGLLGVATALLFWGSGGDFRVDGFTSDFRPRLSSVQVGRADELKAPSVRGDGLLTVIAYPGSPIFVDDSHTPLQQDGHELFTPFSRVPLKAGLHSFRLHPGLGLDDLLIAQQSMGEGRELMLVPVGSSLAPREIADQIVLEEANGDRPLRTLLLGRTFSGHGSVLRVVAWLLAIFALVWSLAAARARATERDAAMRAAAGLLGAYVLARVEPIVAPALSSGLTVALVAVAAVLALAPLVRKTPDGEAARTGDDGVAAAATGPAFLALLVPPPGSGLAPADAAVAPRARTLDAMCAGVFALLVLVLLVSGR